MRVAIFGDHPLLPTGYGGQNRQLLAHLQARGHEVASFSYQHPFAPYTYHLPSPLGGTFGLPTYSAIDTFAVRRSLAAFRPDVLVHNRDVWGLVNDEKSGGIPFMPAIEASREQDNPSLAWIIYSPVDGPMYGPDFMGPWATSDYNLTTTRWGVDVLRRHGYAGPNLGVLYPGVDHREFTRRGRTDIDDLGLPSDRPIITSVGTNTSQRKMLGTVMVAFRRYLEHFDKEAILYLHTAPDGWYKIDQLTAGMGLLGKVFARDVKGKSALPWGYENEAMARLYRASAAYVNLANREGFDSPAAEAAACGCPTVVSDQPVHREIQKVGGERWNYTLAPSRLDFPEHYTLSWACDPFKAAKAIASAVRTGRGKGGVPKALRWDTLASELERFCHLAVEARERAKK